MRTTKHYKKAINVVKNKITAKRLKKAYTKRENLYIFSDGDWEFDVNNILYKNAIKINYYSLNKSKKDIIYYDIQLELENDIFVDFTKEQYDDYMMDVKSLEQIKEENKKK